MWSREATERTSCTPSYADRRCIRGSVETALWDFAEWWKKNCMSNFIFNFQIMERLRKHRPWKQCIYKEVTSLDNVKEDVQIDRFKRGNSSRMSYVVCRMSYVVCRMWLFFYTCKQWRFPQWMIFFQREHDASCGWHELLTVVDRGKHPAPHQ